jgi:hypothetical protein
METNHVWIVHAKRGSADRSKETGWSPVFREYSEESANNLANLVLGSKKSSQIKISKHVITNGKIGSNAEWNTEPVSENFIGKFSRSPKPIPAPKKKPVKPVIVTKDMTKEERAHARRLYKMTEEAKPHARTATDRKRG